jgi:hypothetical protein
LPEKDSLSSRMTGTTLKVYRLLYKEGRPLGVNEIQKMAGLSSPSVAHYHLAKLVSQGLVLEKDGGYVVDKTLFENMIRIRRSLIPLQTTFAIFFATTLAGLLFIVRPATLSSLYIFALVINLVALGIFLFQTYDTLRKWRI